jgi:uncharacterized membrane protein
MIKENYEYLLGGHFDLFLILFSPFVFIFKSYTLLIVQIVSILAGSIGVYRYFSLSHAKSSYLPLLAATYSLLFYGVVSAVSYDYHSTVVASMLIPWLFYFLKKKNFILSCVLLALILVSQENMSLFMLFIFLGLSFEYRKNRTSLKYLLSFAVISLLYFMVVIRFIIPSFSNANEYTGFTFSVLGNNPLEALKSFFTQPFENIRVLFVNHNNSIAGDYVKAEMMIMVLVSGAYILLMKPHYLFMLIPVLFQKLYNDNYLVWGIDGQYSIEFAPILAIGIFTAISEFKDSRTVKILSAIVFIGALFSTLRVMDNTVMYTNKSKIRFYQAGHYQRKYNVKDVHQQIRKIPADAAVSAQSPFVPHLALRDKIYQFPLLKDAEYIVASEKEGKYPLDEVSFSQTMEKLKSDENWEITFSNSNLIIFKRR